MTIETINSIDSICSLAELRDYVNVTLCDQNQLELDAFPISERQLFQNEAFCGMMFCVHGPRSIQLNAIWESTKNTVLFYSANGGKTGKMQLQNAIELNDSQDSLQQQAG